MAKKKSAVAGIVRVLLVALVGVGLIAYAVSHRTGEEARRVAQFRASTADVDREMRERVLVHLSGYAERPAPFDAAFDSARDDAFKAAEGDNPRTDFDLQEYERQLARALVRHLERAGKDATRVRRLYEIP